LKKEVDTLLEEEVEHEEVWVKKVSKENISMMTLNNIIHPEEDTEGVEIHEKMMISDQEEEDSMDLKEAKEVEGLEDQLDIEEAEVI
jgi:hypothetical protein